MRINILLGALCLFFAAAGSTTGYAQAAPLHHAPPPPLYTNLGTQHRDIGSKVPRAQAYFDQGLRLYYGFNQEEAARAFQTAAQLDPANPMPHWGTAIVIGPNVNFPMDSAVEPRAYAESRIAARLSSRASAPNRALINALTVRYSDRAGTSRARADSAYVDAMRRVARRYPGDADVNFVFAEALMLLHPWDWFTSQGLPNGGTEEAIAVLERTIKTNPDHIGACHLYIHAVEMSHSPQRALRCAERLAALAPGAGHLVHMPAHTFIRVGRYKDAVRVNQHAAHTDASYIGEQHPTGTYPLYYGHNLHFLWFAASMTGQSDIAIKAARDLTAAVPLDLVRVYPAYEFLLVPPMHALARFERWRDAVAVPAPPPAFKYVTAIWHYTRGLGFAKLALPDSADVELQAMRATAMGIGDDQILSITNNTRRVLRLAERTLEAEIAASRGRNAEATALYRQAIAIEDSLSYDEPPIWYLPTRWALGQLVLRLNRPADAQALFVEDLERQPENGWSLRGLHRSLVAQGKNAEAAAVERRLRAAWSDADRDLVARP